MDFAIANLIVKKYLTEIELIRVEKGIGLTRQPPIKYFRLFFPIEDD
jgi:hypothetical protein